MFFLIFALLALWTILGPLAIVGLCLFGLLDATPDWLVVLIMGPLAWGCRLSSVLFGVPR